MKNIKKNKNIRLAGDFPESPVFDPITELQNADKVLAFENVTDYGASNVPLSQLVNRDAFLNAKIDALPATQQEVNERLISNKYVSPATLPVVAQVIVGCFMDYSFPKANLTGTGWYACDGSLYPISSPVGQVLNNLSVDYRTSWNIEIVNTSIRIHDLITSPAHNEGGYIRRAVQDGLQGRKQEDQMQAHQHFPKIGNNSGPLSGIASGASVGRFGTEYPDYNTILYSKDADFPNAGDPRVGNESRMLNVGVLPIVYLGV